MSGRNEGIIALLMVLALVAFIIGSAIGITISLEEHDNATKNNNTTLHVENVTEQMTSGVGHNNKTVEFDYVADAVDFNDNYTREMYNLTDK